MIGDLSTLSWHILVEMPVLKFHAYVDCIIVPNVRIAWPHILCAENGHEMVIVRVCAPDMNM